ncbi:MAG: GNAT family N-acetyltransferase [Bacillota bacterium]
MAEQPQRVRLRPPEMGDLENLWRWINDPDVNAFRWEGQQWPKSHEQVRADLEATVRGHADKMELIIETPDGRPVGFVALGGLDRHNGKGELTIVLGERDAWGQGLGSEAVRQVLDLAFDNLRLNKVWLQVDAEHVKAIASYQRLGFKVEGRLREDWYRRGQFADTVVMGLLAREWKQRTVA